MKKQALNLVSLLSLALAAALFAPPQAAADDYDPPGRVARLSYAQGKVSFEPAGTEDWVSAVVNRPVTTGDKLWSDNGSRAELHLGAAAIRLSSNTGFSFLNLDDRAAQIRLTEGTLNIRVRNLDQDEVFEIDTPNLAFSILRPGNYKIEVNESGDTTIVTVRSGEGEVTGGGSAYSIHPREVGTFNGTDQLDADVQSYYLNDDDFDRFCASRDRREDTSQSARYVSTDVAGYEDLDDYGGWRPVPEYGTVWFPHTTVVGWAPYRYGHWVWISPWGWTWVDDAPWGFAPFHYGRWVTVGGVWGWVPCAPRTVVGVAYVRPVYAPALVAWVGGPHFSIGIGIGGGAGVAWFPLGPREVYVPSYRVSRTYVNNLNVSNTTVNTTVVNNYYNTVVVNKNVTNIKYVNQTATNGVTATSEQNFRSAQPVGRNMMRVDRREVESAQVNYSTPNVAPQQRSVLGAGAPTSARPPARLQERAVVARTAPPPAPVSFVKQQQDIQANGGRPPDMSQMRQAQPGNGNVAQPRSNIKMAPPATAGTPQNGRDNRRPGEQQYNPGNNRPGQPQTNVQNNSNNAMQPQGNPPNNSNRPPGVNNVVQPPPANQPNTPPPPNNGPNRSYNDRPGNARPNNANYPPPVNPQLDQKQQQEQQQLRQKQDQERQRIEQKQMQEQQKIQQKNAEDARRQQVEQRQQQQLQQLEQKHTQEQQRLQHKQQQQVERQQGKPAGNPPKPPKDQKEDKPHN